MSIMLDGGNTLAKLAELLIPSPGLLVVTPSPVIATILIDKDIATHLIGGRISPWGGVAVGGEAERALSNLTVDLAFLGVCGLEASFGVGADDGDEASLKQVMAYQARAVSLLCQREKIGHKARHRVLEPSALSCIVTDALPSDMMPFQEAGSEIIHV